MKAQELNTNSILGENHLNSELIKTTTGEYELTRYQISDDLKSNSSKNLESKYSIEDLNDSSIQDTSFAGSSDDILN